MILHQFLRVSTNYARLIIGFLAGILVVRQLLAYGEDIFNIYTVVTVGAGIGIMLKEILRIALVPLLTEHWQKNKNDFSTQYAAAFALSLIAASTGLLIMVLLATSMNRLSIQQENVFAAQVLSLIHI